jgi:hypothetical protein
MKKGWFISDTHDEPDRIEGFEPIGCRWIAAGMLAFWLAVAALVYACNASAAGRRVYLEDERDLENGFKLCIYSEGITITRPSYQLCPISIEV